jgi:hypothetical protein
METTLAVVLMCFIAAELLILCSNLSKLRTELGQHQEKLISELSEVRKSLEKKT